MCGWVGGGGGGGAGWAVMLGNFQSQGVLLLWTTAGQGLLCLQLMWGGGCLDIFSLAITSFFPVWERV